MSPDDRYRRAAILARELAALAATVRGPAFLPLSGAARLAALAAARLQPARPAPGQLF